MVNYIEAGGSPVVSGGAFVFNVTIRRGGVALDLTGKTVSVSVRTASQPGAVIDEALEDQPVTVTNAEDGETSFTLTPDMTALLSGHTDPTKTVRYYLQYYSPDDDYYPDLVRFQVRNPAT